MNEDEIPLTFKGFTQAYDYPTMGSLRKMAFESERNGFGEAFLKLGRRRLVLPKTLFRLIREKGTK